MVSPGIGVGCSGKSQGMGSGIAGTSSFLRNLRFHKVILPGPSILIRKWWLWRVSMTRPVVFHRWVLWRCIEIICPFWSDIGCAQCCYIAFWGGRYICIYFHCLICLFKFVCNVHHIEWHNPKWYCYNCCYSTMLRKIFSWVPIHQRSILAFEYPWNTTAEHFRKKDKKNAFVHRKL